MCFVNCIMTLVTILSNLQLMQNVKLRQVSGPDPHYPDVCFEGAGRCVNQD